MPATKQASPTSTFSNIPLRLHPSQSIAQSLLQTLRNKRPESFITSTSSSYPLALRTSIPLHNEETQALVASIYDVKRKYTIHSMMLCTCFILFSRQIKGKSFRNIGTIKSFTLHIINLFSSLIFKMAS